MALDALFAEYSLGFTIKVVHSVLDSLNRRRVPSREILVKVDGPDDVDGVTEVARRLVEQLERREGRSLMEMPSDSIRRYAEELIAAADDKTHSDLPAVSDKRARALLDEMQKAAPDSQ